MKQKEPLVSVVMTAYNAGEFVGEAVESILNQTYPNLELIIVNDGSTDRTGKILRVLAKKDKRIVFINCRKNRGASTASNLGLLRVHGQYIARMDADDIAMPDRLMRQVNFLQKHPKVVAVGGQCELIDRDGNSTGVKNFPLNHKEIYNSLYMYNPIQHPCLMINTKLAKGDNITYHTAVLLAHDLEILFRLSQCGELANLDETVLKYRIHGDSLSLKNPKATFAHTVTVRTLARKEYGYTPSIAAWVVHGLQISVMMLLPNALVYPLFRMLRVKKLADVKAQLSYATAVIATVFSR